MKKTYINFILIVLVVLAGCEDAFEYSPYAANVKDSYKGIGGENFKLINDKNQHVGSFKFAVFADSHYSYHELNGAISSVNKQDDIDFVIVNGDMADHGYLKEFELFHERMKNLDVPYLTVIGNHDYRSNGEDIYSDMYGPKNYTLKYSNTFFIMWDNIFWESNKNPDFIWLEEQLVNATDYENIIVVCHIPPFGSQFDEENELHYSELMQKYKVKMSIHGHNHSNYHGTYYHDGIDYLVVESIIDEQYAILSVNNNNVDVEIIKY